MTVKKPHCLVIDLRARIQANQAYVMLSRVQELKQLSILGHLPEEKIFASSEAIDEFERMKSVAINNKFKRKATVTSMNIFSLKKHFKDMKSSQKFTLSDVICIQETWIESEKDDISNFQIIGFKAHFNSVGKGKGISTYFTNKFSIEEDITESNYQITKIVSEEKDVINVYRSKNAPAHFLEDLMSLINLYRHTFIIGDFNICYKEEKGNRIIKTLEENGFRLVLV